MNQPIVRPSDVCFNWIKQPGIKAKISGVFMLLISLGLCIAIVWIVANLIQVVVPSSVLGYILAITSLYTVSFLAWPWVKHSERYHDQS